MRVAIIPARMGSRRIPRKNIRDFHGKPILAYSIETAKASGLFDHVMVSSEDPVIMGLAFELGAEFLLRSTALSQDEVGTQQVVKDAIRGMQVSHVCCIYATAPMLTVNDLQRGFRELKREDVWFAFGVGTRPLRDAGLFYWSKAFALQRNEPLYGPRAALIPVDEDRVCDINTEEDWQRAEKLYLQHTLSHPDLR